MIRSLAPREARRQDEIEIFAFVYYKFDGMVFVPVGRSEDGAYWYRPIVYLLEETI